MSLETNTEVTALRAALLEIYELPNVIQRNKLRAHYALSAVSAGKPWVDYIGVGERMRLRIVERWRVDAETREERAGVIKIVMQHILPCSAQAEGSFAFDSMRIVLEDTEEVGRNDVCVTTKAKVNIMGSGSVQGVVSRAQNLEPYSGGHAESIATDMIKYSDNQGLYEQEYSSEPVHEYGLMNIVDAVNCFVSQEKELARQRSVLLRNTK